MTADALPAPPVPSYLDLRDLDYMPLKVRVLRDSQVAATAPPEVYRALTMLWCAAWHQVPAGSLPNNEKQLAVLTGVAFGKEWKTLLDLAEAWVSGSRIAKSVGRKTEGSYETIAVTKSIVRRVTEEGADGRLLALLDGWMLCSDSRFYHRLISLLAVTAWNTWNTVRYSREYERNRKNNFDRRARGELTIRLTRPDLAVYSWPLVQPKLDPSDYAGIPIYAATGVDASIAAGLNLTTEVDPHERAPAKKARAKKAAGASSSEPQTIELPFISPAQQEQIPGGHRKPSTPPGRVAAKEQVANELRREAISGDVWNGYADAYYLRYHTEPLRNAAVNSQLKLFVQRVGKNEAPILASFYLTLNAKYYVEKMHAVGPMVRDAESIFAQWKTGINMTAGKAAAVDRAQTTVGAFSKLITDAERKE